MNERIESYSCCLRVGVTGHRIARLGDVDLACLADAVREVMSTISAQLPHAKGLHLLSSLADGADSIVADTAVELGWCLDVILPLPSDDYAQDFPAGAPREAHGARLAKAHTIFELIADVDRAAAYERAGRVVLAQSDMLLAIWDGEPARGRGGAPQIIAEAIAAGVPVIHLNPLELGSPGLLWDGLIEHDFDQQALGTVASAELDRLPELVTRLTEPPADPVEMRMLTALGTASQGSRWRLALAYPMLLMIMGVRRLRRADLVAPRVAMDRSTDLLATWFLRADHCATAAGQSFRSAYVLNFSLAAFAVIASLARLVLPYSLNPVLAVLEGATIAAILAITHIGHRAHWHRRWLDQRHLAERLRCLLVTRLLGQLGLRRGRGVDSDWVNWVMHGAARMTGLPSASANPEYLTQVRGTLLALIDDQLTYLRLDAARMLKLEHRLHNLGTTLFGLTAVICASTLVLEMFSHSHLPEAFSTLATITTAALPACGAAIYGIRMQGDFAGIAERSTAVAEKLHVLRTSLAGDPLHFDRLWERARQAQDVLTQDVLTWLHAYRARPLALPG